MRHKNLFQRLKKLESAITPKQFILIYRGLMMDSATILEWGEKASSDDFLMWLEERQENVHEAAIKKQLGNKKDPAASHKIALRTRQEITYLYTMALSPSTQFEQNRYRYLYWVSELKHRYIELIAEGQRGFPNLLENDSLKNELLLLKDGIEKVLAEMRSDLLCERKISRRFFDGRPLLFKEQEALLNREIALLEFLMGLFKSTLPDIEKAVKRRGAKKSKDVSEVLTWLATIAPDPQWIEQEIEVRTERQFERVKNEAKFWVFESEGRDEESTLVFRNIMGF